MSKRTEPNRRTELNPGYREIVEDCPRCAYKHLAAAYAAATRCRGAEICADAPDILAAQARIAAGEAATGYPGNMAHAVGCLALAETMVEDTEDRDRYRSIRRLLECGELDAARDLAVTWESLAAAHVAEAMRECPELADRVSWALAGGMVGVSFNPRDFRNTLRAQLRWLSETYELGYREPEAAEKLSPLVLGFVDKALAPAPGFVEHLRHQLEWSHRTFGPDGDRTQGLVDHIGKELGEIMESKGADVEEWIDVVILALDGAMRSGNTPEQVWAALQAKQAKNEARKWPDWRKAEPGSAIEHIREERP